MHTQLAARRIGRLLASLRRQIGRWVMVLAVMLGYLGMTPAPAAAATILVVGPIASNTTWTAGNVYWVLSNTTVQPGVTLTIHGGAVVKFALGRYLDVFGTLDMQGSAGNEVIFTSERDDTAGGDTNGDLTSTEAALGDWQAIYLENSLTTFEHAIVRYSATGVNVFNNTGSTISPEIANNTFAENGYGVLLSMNAAGGIESSIHDNSFTHNIYGLGVNFYSEAATGTARPTVTNNAFNTHTGYPIYLGASAYPTYSGNTFTTNAHPAIALGGHFTSDGTWTVVNGMPFVVAANTTIRPSVVVTLPVGAIVKFERDRYLTAQGELELLSTAVTSPTVFTSFWDDDYGGDTNGDGICPSCTLEPQPGDWNAVYLESTETDFAYTIVRYASKGLWVYNNTDDTWSMPIANNVFDRNQTGLYLNSRAGKSGLINSLVTGNTFSNGAQGFPIYLDGSAYPQYGSNTYTNNLHPAIGVQGVFKHSGTWPIINSMPYVVADHTTLTATKTLTLPVGMVIKFEAGKYIAVDGNLILQSTSTGNPIVFTSFKDDAYAGDTNGDGSLTRPARGDWEAVYLQGPGTLFDFARVQYGARGVSVYNNTGITLTTPITSTYLTENTYGVYLHAGKGDITSVIRNNTFFSNTHGLGTSTDGQVGDTSYPLVQGNAFDRHSGFPIYLGGSAFPTYSGNTFTNSTHPAVGLGGWFNDSGTWTIVNGMPFVVDVNTYISSTATVTLPVNSVFKFENLRYLEALGNLVLLSTNATAPIIFTSYKDDAFAGDTNADGGATVPAREDWDAIYLENSGTTFDYARVRFSKWGINVYSGCGCTGILSPTIANNLFEENTYGVYLYAGEHNILSPIRDNVFSSNTYGLGTGTNGQLGATSYPLLQNNAFNNHSGFPIYLGGSAFPNYVGNTFSNNTHPAIALGGWFNDSGTWPIVNNMPYVVKDDVSIDIGVAVTVPAAEVFKFDLSRYLHVFGMLNLQSTLATDPVVFTSYRDDSHLGDTNADGTSTTPAASDWKTVWLYSSATTFDYTLVKYGTSGVSVYYEGPVNTNIFPRIANNVLTQNLIGNLLVIGYDSDIAGTGGGNITSQIENNQFASNGYGLVTYAHPLSTGISQPTLTDNSFVNHSGFPIYLGGTAYPIYTGNLALDGQNLPAFAGSDLPAPHLPTSELALGVSRAVSVKGEAAPEAAQPAAVDQPAVGNVFSGNTHRAIGLAGSFNGTGTWALVDNMPYVVGAFYPLVVDNYVPNADVRVGISATVSLPPNSVVKLSSDRYLDVHGSLNLLGSASNPVVFTSYRDDAQGGDSNADGTATTPTRGDWRAVFLESSGTLFDYAVVKYASQGVHIYYSGPINTNIFPEVAHNFFLENLVGLSFSAVSDGALTSSVHDNVFLNNTTHMRGTTGGGAGRLLLTVINNDLYGSQAGPMGLEILSANATVTGTLNWWGACSGPYHSSQNPAGQGTPVSNYVNFTPWQCVPTQGITTYSVLGQVLDDNEADPEPIGGVTIRLGPTLTATTGVDGFYTFSNLPFGTYTVTAELDGYSFFPLQRTITVPGDATEVNFRGILGVGPDIFTLFVPLITR